MLSTGYIRIAVFLVVGAVCTAHGQNNDAWSPFPDRDRKRDEDSKLVKDMLSKQQSDREKKEHQEMLERGERALELSKELEKAFEMGESLSSRDERKLVELEKIATKIRNDLGGSDDEELESVKAEKRPSSLREGFDALKGSTVKLVDELKKTTRYSISVVAIETSNAVIKLARFLRLRN